MIDKRMEGKLRAVIARLVEDEIAKVAEELQHKTPGFSAKDIDELYWVMDHYDMYDGALTTRAYHLCKNTLEHMCGTTYRIAEGNMSSWNITAEEIGGLFILTTCWERKMEAYRNTLEYVLSEWEETEYPVPDEQREAVEILIKLTQWKKADTRTVIKYGELFQEASTYASSRSVVKYQCIAYGLTYVLQMQGHLSKKQEDSK